MIKEEEERKKDNDQIHYGNIWALFFDLDKVHRLDSMWLGLAFGQGAWNHKFNYRYLRFV